jgi:PAS domain S-box-containing protein
VDRALLEQLFAHAPIAIELRDYEGRVLAANRAFEALLAGGGDLIARFDLHADLDRALAGETVRVPAQRVEVPGARRRVVAITLVPLHDGRVAQVAVFVEDVSAEADLRLTGDALGRSEEELAATLESLADAVIGTDNAGGIVRMNAVAERLTGWSTMDARGRGLGEILRIEEDANRRSLLLSRDGRVTPVTSTGAPIRSSDGRLIGTVVVFRDVGEERRAEELRQRSAELELDNRRIVESSRLKSEFLASMSHELRTPLNAILGFAELLRDRRVDPMSPEHDEFVRSIVTSGRHLLQLINDLLDLAKVEAGRLELRPIPVVIGSIVHEVVAILRQQAAGRGITVDTLIDPALTDATLDPARLRQVLYNYLSNAIKFSPDGGRIQVRAIAQEDLFRLEVEDEGPGIAPVDLGRLFVEFQQLEGGLARRHPGTGLGLALTRRLVEAQGGTVGVLSTPGRGSIFHVVLPRHARPGHARLGRRRTLAPRHGAPTVLVVEEAPRDQALLVSALAEAGFAVDLVGTGADALARCRERTFDGIVLDLALPDMSGFEVLTSLRTGPNRATPVIALTHPDEVTVGAGDVDDVLAKPVYPEELVTALRRAARRRG